MTTETSAGSQPSASAAICANVVPWPCPCVVKPGRDEDLAARLDADVGALVRADAGALDVAAETEPEIAPGAPRLGLLAGGNRGADHLERHREPGG